MGSRQRGAVGDGTGVGPCDGHHGGAAAAARSGADKECAIGANQLVVGGRHARDNRCDGVGAQCGGRGGAAGEGRGSADNRTIFAVDKARDGGGETGVR